MFFHILFLYCPYIQNWIPHCVKMFSLIEWGGCIKFHCELRCHSTKQNNIIILLINNKEDSFYILPIPCPLFMFHSWLYICRHILHNSTLDRFLSLIDVAEYPSMADSWERAKEAKPQAKMCLDRTLNSVNDFICLWN